MEEVVDVGEDARMNIIRCLNILEHGIRQLLNVIAATNIDIINMNVQNQLEKKNKQIILN